MPNIKSQIKRAATNEKARQANAAAKSEARTAMKKVEAAVQANDKAAADAALHHAISLLDKLAQSGIYARNTVTRKKAHLQRIVAAL